jgi:hypothetical protein
MFDEQTIGYSFIQQNTPFQIEPIIFSEPETPESNSSNPIFYESLKSNSSNPTPSSPPSPISTPDLPNLNQTEPLDIPQIQNNLPQPASDFPVQPIRRTYPSREVQRRPNSKFCNHYLFNVIQPYPNSDYIIESKHFYEAAQHPRWAMVIQKEIE